MSKDESSPCFSRKSQQSGTKSKANRPSLSDIFDDGSRCSSTQPPAPILNSYPIVTQVYRAETTVTTPTTARELDKSEILLGAIIRTSERNDVDMDATTDETDGEVGWKKLWSKPESFNEDDLLQSQINHGITNANGTMSKNIDVVDRMRACSLSDDQNLAGYEDEEEEELQEDDEDLLDDRTCIPTINDQEVFRKSFSSATSMVFHGRTGLPLTSSPAPLRKGKNKFEYDSSITSPNDIKRALFRAQSQKDPSKNHEAKTEGSSPSASKVSTSDVTEKNNNGGARKRNISSAQRVLSASAPASVVTSSNLLGNFEESVLNGRLEPVSTVEGFTAEIGASGSFHPKHRVVPVTVFFYTLCDSNAVSSPYLGNY